MDPIALSHILKNTGIYEKPWESRQLLTSLFGFGLLTTEGVVHKRQRRVILPAFGAPNMRSLVKISFKKGVELKNALMDVLPMSCEEKTIPTAKIDVLRWLGRATFDVIGLAGELTSSR
jgi:cytochrome P450